MRTRTFLGLILLVAALMVASIPALLDPTARGVEQLAVKADLVPDRAAEAKREAKVAKQRASGEPAEKRLELNGYVVEEDGDLRDTAPVGDRAFNERGRTQLGTQRVRMPGQKPGSNVDAPPFAAEDGVLLDVTGCPVFRPEADVTALMADEKTKALYAKKIGSADDAAACEATFADRVELATAVDIDTNLPGDRRKLASLIRSDSERMYLELFRVGLFADMMGADAEQQAELVTELREGLR